jgi:YnbE-like lipoprotein
MICFMLTRERQDANRLGMKILGTIALTFTVSACGGCVRVQAPDKPIEINLNVKIRQEVIVSLKRDASELVNENSGLFPQ